MGSCLLHMIMSNTGKMIVLGMFSLLLLVDAGPTISESSTQDAEVYRSCDYDTSICSDYDVCCDKGDGYECMSMDDCLGVDADTLFGLGIAAAVSIIVVPILCCCCCGGCALYWIMKRRKDRRGQVHQQGVHMMQPQQPGIQMMQGGQAQPQGYPTGGFVAQPQGYEQGNQAGGMYPSVPNPENVK